MLRLSEEQKKTIMKVLEESHVVRDICKQLTGNDPSSQMAGYLYQIILESYYLGEMDML